MALTREFLGIGVNILTKFRFSLTKFSIFVALHIEGYSSRNDRLVASNAWHVYSRRSSAYNNNNNNTQVFYISERQFFNEFTSARKARIKIGIKFYMPHLLYY